jgi:hypothetical protein
MSKLEGVQDIEEIKEFIASKLLKNQKKIRGANINEVHT